MSPRIFAAPVPSSSLMKSASLLAASLLLDLAVLAFIGLTGGWEDVRSFLFLANNRLGFCNISSLVLIGTWSGLGFGLKILLKPFMGGKFSTSSSSFSSYFFSCSLKMLLNFLDCYSGSCSYYYSCSSTGSSFLSS